MNPLKDLLPPKVRQALYVLLTIVIAGFGAVQAATSDDVVDWFQAASIFVSALIPLLAASNVSEPPAV